MVFGWQLSCCMFDSNTPAFIPLSKRSKRAISIHCFQCTGVAQQEIIADEAAIDAHLWVRGMQCCDDIHGVDVAGAVKLPTCVLQVDTSRRHELINRVEGVGARPGSAVLAGPAPPAIACTRLGDLVIQLGSTSSRNVGRDA